MWNHFKGTACQVCTNSQRNSFVFRAFIKKSSTDSMLLAECTAADEGRLSSQHGQTPRARWGAGIRNPATAFDHIRRWLPWRSTGSAGGGCRSQCSRKQRSDDTSPCGHPKCLPPCWCSSRVPLRSRSYQVITTCWTLCIYYYVIFVYIILQKWCVRIGWQLLDQF